MPRQHSRRRRRGLGGPLYSVLSTLVVVVCVSAALTMFFRVRDLQITGLSRYTEEQVRKAAGVEYGDNLFFMDKYAMKDEILRQLPYVESIRINRTYPDTLRINVQECSRPMALEQDGTVWLISATGKIVDSIRPGGASDEADPASDEADPASDGAETNGDTERGAAGVPETDAETKNRSETAASERGTGAASESGTGAASESGTGAASENGTGAAAETDGAGRTSSGMTVEQYGVITGCRLLAPAVGNRISLVTENVFYQQSLLDLLSALDGSDLLEELDAIHMDDPSVLRLECAGRFTVKLRYDADFPWKLRALEEYMGNERIQENMVGTFDMTKDDKNYFQQDVR